MSQLRHLAAIMFTDIVGYTALMGENEQKAIDLLHRNRQLQQPLIKHFNGSWVKEMGDGVLATFSSVADAVTCAGAIQQTCTQIPGLQLRIGIHLGDIVVENNDVFGDGVNIASRIQALAAIGTIWVSEVVHNIVSNKNHISSKFIREETLKNVQERIRIYEVTVESSADLGLSSAPKQNGHPQVAKTVYEKSVAVLPFVNMSNDADQEYFSDGMAEEIINSLTHVKDLKVAGRTSSFQFKGKNIDLREIGDKLFVRTVLEGSVRKQGNRLRITAQLINVEDGYHLWSERYDRDMNDIFAIQEEIAIAISEKLKVTLQDKERALFNKNPTEDHEAYDLYLKGRYYLNKRGPSLRTALAFFQQAAEIDPAFALAYAGMADAYAILGFYAVMPPHDVMPKAKQYAEKAIQLDPIRIEPYTTRAFISVFYDWNWAEAKKQFQQIFSLNPNYPEAHYWHSYYLSFVERKFEDAIREAKYAAEHLEPLVSFSHHVLSMMLVNAGRYAEALVEAKIATELEANYSPGYRGIGLSLAGLNRYDESIEALKKASQLSGRHPWYLVELCWVYSLSGNLLEAQNIVDDLMLRSKTEFVSPLFLSGAAYFTKNADLSYDLLEAAFEQRDGVLPCLNTWPLCSYIREDPRFQPFRKRMNFPE